METRGARPLHTHDGQSSDAGWWGGEAVNRILVKAASSAVQAIPGMAAVKHAQTTLPRGGGEPVVSVSQDPAPSDTAQSP